MADVGQQGVHDDVEKLAAYFVSHYKTLEAAASAIDHDTEWNIPQFRAELKRWGVLVADPDELFYHIDADYSGRISFLELYAVLSQPVAEVKVREERRQSAEVTAIYEELAGKIRDHGGVEDAFKAVGAVGGLTIAQFRQLLKKIDMELSHAQVTRVFQRIDADHTKTVSIQELRDALGYYLVRGTLVDLAAHLSETCGSVGAAFDSSRAERRQSFTGSPPPSLPASPMNPSTASALLPMLPLDSLMPMSEKEFLTLLRRLKVLVEGSASSFLKPGDADFLFLHLRGPSFTAEDFKLRLEKVHDEQRKLEEDLEQRRARTEQMKKRRAFTELPGIGGVVARGRQAAWQTGKVSQTEVDAWTAEAAKAGSQTRPEEVTRMWEIDARSGKSRAQLQDYQRLLEDQIFLRQRGVQELQEEVEGRWDGLHGWDTSPTSPDTPMPNAFGMSGSLRRDKRGAKVGQSDGFLDQSRRQQQAAVRSKRIIQASAVGDVAGLQSVLKDPKDVNIAGWGGVTPLMTAARHGREAALQTLLAFGAEIGCTDSHGRTAVDHARQAPISLRSGVLNCLTGHGGLSGQELKAQVDALARRVLDIEAECSRLNHYKGKLPSREELNENKAVLKRMETRKGLARTASRGGLGDQTPSARPSPRSARSSRSQWEEDMPSFGLPGGFGAGGAGLSRDAAIMRSLMAEPGTPHLGSPFGAGAGVGDVFTTAGFQHKPPLLPIPGVAGGRRW